MVTPKKREILSKAKIMDAYDNVMKGLPAITPEEHELKETGTFREAQIDLMRNEAIGQRLQMRKYLENMAQELNLRIVSRREFGRFQRFMLKPARGIVEKKKARVRGRVPPTIPVPKVIKDATVLGIGVKGMPSRVAGLGPAKKRKRKAPARPKRARTMRSIRHVRGVKIFSYPDEVWKVREPRRKKGR